jgi:hypothetical protein
MTDFTIPAFKLFRLDIPELGGGYTLVLGRFGLMKTANNEIQRYSKNYFIADCFKNRFVTFSLPQNRNKDIIEITYYRFNEAFIGGGYVDSYIIASFINLLQFNIDNFIADQNQHYTFYFTPEQQADFNNSHPRN